jgi:hypothetical protein
MADSKISALTNYAVPLAGADIIPIVDTTNSQTKGITLAELHAMFTNQSVTSQGAGFASDTYLTGSNILLPGAPFVGTTYKLWFDVVKTGAGTATPIISVRVGTAGAIGDTAILTFTFGAGTAAADTGIFSVLATFRTVGASTSAVLQGQSGLISNLTTTGLSNAKKALQVTSSGFNSTVANSYIGASYNGGASASHTVQLVRAELIL